MRTVSIGRRCLLANLALSALQGCSSPLQPLPISVTEPRAQSLLAASAAAHGLPALSAVRDVSLRYAGHWRSIVGALQPALVDAGFRGTSEERLLLRSRVLAQSYLGPSGHKQVLRQTGRAEDGSVTVSFNGEPARDRERRDAAALVADGYCLFLLGPMLLAGTWATDRTLVLALAGQERITSNGQEVDCDIVRVRMVPGVGFSGGDDLAVFIDRDRRLMRRVRFTLNGLASTQGAVAEVDTSDHVAVHGVLWPTRFHEQLLRPLPLPVHDWRLEGLDVDRGLELADVSGTVFTGQAARPAAVLPSQAGMAL